MIDISIIIPTISANGLIRTLDYISRQQTDGLTYELIVVQEAKKHSVFHKVNYGDLLYKTKILKQDISSDFGAKAKDRGLAEASGKYCLFWDDDNLFHQHALVSQYNNAHGFDIGISRIYHEFGIIPSEDKIIDGNIDTMCICVKRTLAIQEKWSDGTNERHSDYRYISRLCNHSPTVRYSKVIIGHHLSRSV